MAKEYIFNTTGTNPAPFINYNKGTVQNVVNFKKYDTNPKLVANQVAEQSKLIITSRGLEALKTASYIIDRETYQEGENLRNQQTDAKSRFGTAIFDVIQFSGPGNSTVGDGNDDKLVYTERSWDINRKEFVEREITVEPTELTTALLTVTQHKNIVVTNVQGRPGPVYEYISQGAYQINIKGVIASPFRDVYPEEAVSNLVDFLEAPTAIQVLSYTLNKVWNIFDIVVMDYNFYSDEGIRNVVHFEINCQNEVPFQVKNTK